MEEHEELFKCVNIYTDLLDIPNKIDHRVISASRNRLFLFLNQPF